MEGRADTVSGLHIRVLGLPAPQGSKDFGINGQLIESSRYLPEWRRRVKAYATDAVVRAYRERGVAPDPPYLRGPVVIECARFYVVRPVNPGEGFEDVPAGPPDVDKYLRSTLDGLTTARVYKDDARVTDVWHLSKRYATAEQPPGAFIIIRERKPVDDLA